MLLINNYNIQFTSWMIEPITHINKISLTKYSIKHFLPVEKTWSCNKNLPLQCGECMNCKSRKATFKIIKHPDNTQYLSNFKLITLGLKIIKHKLTL